jgi:threonine dehydratase
MTLVHDQLQDIYLEQLPTVDGDAAFGIIEQHRDIVGELAVEPLEVEFPSFNHYLERMGSGALYLANAHDNTAGTFKVRGALNGMHQLREKGEKKAAVPSAGNHARGAAEAARKLDIETNFVVPTTAPPAKSKGLYELWPGGRLRVFQEGQTFHESLQWLSKHPELGALLHPFDNPDVIAGQGTLVDDIFARVDQIDHIVVPVGGGGLAAGIAHRLTEKRNKHTKLHLMQPTGSDSMSRSLEVGEISEATSPNMRYGGTAVLKVGKYALEILKKFGPARLHLHLATDEMVDDLISDYQFDRKLLGREGTPNLEPTTLVAVAGMQRVVQAHPGESVLVVGTGQNAPLD